MSNLDVRRLLAVGATAAITVCGLTACQFADDGARLLRAAVTESTPLVKTLPVTATDETLAVAANEYLRNADPTLFSRAKALAGDEDVQSIVKGTCAITGLKQADPDEVIDSLTSILSASADSPGLELLGNDAAATADSVRTESAGSLAMTTSAALAVSVFQQVYC